MGNPKSYHPPKTPAEIEFGRLELRAVSRDWFGNVKRSDHEIKVYRASVGYNDNVLYMLDAVGTTGEILALRSCMGKSVSADFRFFECGAIGSYITPERCQVGYRIFTEPLGQRTGGKQLVHFIAISNKQGFMPFVTPHALAKSLATDLFTTPFLSSLLHGEGVPDWMPYLTEKMVDRNVLQYMRNFNCLGGMLMPQNSEIENIISLGVQSGELPWVPFDENEILQAAEAARRKAIA